MGRNEAADGLHKRHRIGTDATVSPSSEGLPDDRDEYRFRRGSGQPVREAASAECVFLIGTMIRGFHQGPRPFGRSSRGRTYASSQPDSERSKERLDRGGVHICFAMQSRRRRKKVGDGRCGRRARRSRSSVRPMPIEIADGAPVSGNRRNTAMAAVPRTSQLENGNGAGSAGRCTITTLILAATASPRPWARRMHMRPRSRTTAARSADDAAEGRLAHRRVDPLGSRGCSAFAGGFMSARRVGRSGVFLAGVDVLVN